MHRPIHWLEISMLIRASERALFAGAMERACI